MALADVCGLTNLSENRGLRGFGIRGGGLTQVENEILFEECFLVPSNLEVRIITFFFIE